MDVQNLAVRAIPAPFAGTDGLDQMHPPPSVSDPSVLRPEPIAIRVVGTRLEARTFVISCELGTDRFRVPLAPERISIPSLVVAGMRAIENVPAALRGLSEPSWMYIERRVA